MPGPLPSKFERLRSAFRRRGGRAEPTLLGSTLFGLCLAVGMAAYNSASNILFVVLALLLASLLLSGALSWLNFRGAEFELHPERSARAGEPALLALVVRNTRRRIPIQGLWFELSARRLSDRGAGKDLGILRARLPLGALLEPGEERRLCWQWTPASRGRWSLRLESVCSLFPFGFLRKRVAVDLDEEVLVRPGPVSLSSSGRVSGLAANLGERRGRARGGDDLHSLREYRDGDSHRLVHWKASARHRRLLVRRFSGADESRCALLFSTDSGLWTSQESFERGLSLAAVLAERLYAEGRLEGLALDDRCQAPVRNQGELESWLDLLAEAERKEGCPQAPEFRCPVTVQPLGTEGALAHACGRTIATA